VKGGRGAFGAFPWGVFAAADGDLVTFHGGADAEWPRFCKAIDRPDLAGEEYRTADQRNERKEELYRELDKEFPKATRAEWAERFRAAGLRCEPALDYSEVVVDRQVAHNGIIMEKDNFRAVATPMKLDGKRPTMYAMPPDIGEQSEEVLVDWGIDPARAAAFVEATAAAATAGGGDEE
jgi:formyl-CoA transferase